MKKAIIFISVICFSFFTGCDFEYHTMTITNNSSKTVSYTMFDEDGTFQLNAGQYREHEAPYKSYLVPRNITMDAPHNVEMIRIDSFNYEFVDIPHISLNIFNQLSVDVNISTGNIQYMDIETLNVPANSINSAYKIYKRNPVFFITHLGHTLKYNLNFDESENTLYVTINNISP